MKTKKTIFSILFVFLPMVFPWQTTKAQSATIRVTVTKIKNQKGVLRALLWNSETGFPKEKKLFYKKVFHKADNDTVLMLFEDVPFGDYAISLFHDVNENREFDRNKLMRTSEPFGLSGKPDFTERPVKFKDCKFSLKKKEQNINIPLMEISDLGIY